MVSIARWIHHLFNPHCADCMLERENSKHCESCETLRIQLELANHDKKLLLEKLLYKPNENAAPISRPIDKSITAPQMIPWRVKQQMLESEDRRKAQLLHTAPKPHKESELRSEITKLEEELGIADDIRESGNK